MKVKVAMNLRVYLSKLKWNYKVVKKIKKKGTFIGTNHHFSPFSRINLEYGAKKENVIIEDGVWMKGKINVQYDGKVVLHEQSKIATTTVIQCVNKVEIGAYTSIAPDTTICDNNNHPVSPSYRLKMELTPEGHAMRSWKYSTSAPIVIGKNCWIGTNVRICKGVKIGDNSVIGACSVVTKDVPANCIAVGNPARIVKTNIDQLSEPIFP